MILVTLYDHQVTHRIETIIDGKQGKRKTLIEASRITRREV